MILNECVVNTNNGTCADCGGESTCGECSGCNWTSGTIDTTDRTCSGVWGSSCVGSDPQLGDYSYDGCSASSYYSSGFWVDEVTVNATLIQLGDTIKVTCNFDCQQTSSNNDLAISYYNGIEIVQVWSQDRECYDGDYSYDIVTNGVAGEQYVRCQIGYYNYNPT